MNRLKAALRRPEVFLPGVIVGVLLLIVATLLWWGPAASTAYHEYSKQRELRWTPGPWALTVDDFPDGAAQEIPVQEEWLEHSAPLDDTSPRIPVPNRVPGLELTSARYAVEGALAVAWNRAAVRDVATLSGVRLGELEVYSAPLHTEMLTSSDDLAEVLAVRAEQRAPDPTSFRAVDSWPELLLDDDPGLEDAAALGDRIVTTPTDFGTVRVSFEGDRGWVGVAGRLPAGGTEDARQAAAVVMPTDGDLVLLGLTAPPDASVDWEAEIEPLLAILEQKMAATPYEGTPG
ncbi:hypothetical protein [Isoptericola aurantiacus]|uniref:hypothetical protein n=1 Tax=Isoptericola aurantiacus TaxID=3377839 RepID=UPI00383AED80